MAKTFMIPILLIVALIFSVLVMPASAVLQVTEYRGTITALNATSRTMTINAVATYGCDYTNSTPVCSWDSINATQVTGTVPDNEVFSDFKSGDPVAASIVGGPGGNWAAVALIFPTPGIENWYATDIHGDPVYVDNVPLAAGYAVAYLTVPDCGACRGTVCTAGSATVEIRAEDRVVANTTLSPGQNVTWNGRNDGSWIEVNFVSGQAPSSACPNATGMMTGPQAISDFRIHVQQPVAGLNTTSATTPPTTVAQTTSPTTSASPTTVPPTRSGLLPVMFIGALCLAGFMFRKRI
jgi:hypothetical protein